MIVFAFSHEHMIEQDSKQKTEALIKLLSFTIQCKLYRAIAHEIENTRADQRTAVVRHC